MMRQTFRRKGGAGMFWGSTRSVIFGTMFLVVMMMAAGSFVVAAVQGDYGVMRRMQLQGEATSLIAQRDAMQAELDQLQNLTRRLSDTYLDLDLLDERARIVLGYLRADEVVIR
jgi:cell division protein FtsB